MSALIPPPGTRGLYSLKAPFTTEPAVLYTCAAIRSYGDLQNHGEDVFKLYYQPLNLTEANFQTDRANGEYLITLTSDTYAPLYVPSSYILSFPNLSSQPYKWVILSASLGMLPDALDLTFAKDQMAAALSNVIGSTVTVQVGSAPYSGVVTPEQHEVLEAARQAKINNRTTDYARVVQLTADKASLTQRLAILEALCKEKGVIPA